MIFIKNSLILVILSTIGVVISSSMIAFGFARLHFRGKAFWFTVMMLTLMLPYEVVMIPQYILFAKLGWLSSFKPIIIPNFFGNAFFIFLLVQFIRTLPTELDEAATIDGCGKIRLFYRIIVPLMTSCSSYRSHILLLLAVGRLAWSSVILEQTELISSIDGTQDVPR